MMNINKTLEICENKEYFKNTKNIDLENKSNHIKEIDFSKVICLPNFGGSNVKKFNLQQQEMFTQFTYLELVQESEKLDLPFVLSIVTTFNTDDTTSYNDYSARELQSYLKQVKNDEVIDPLTKGKILKVHYFALNSLNDSSFEYLTTISMEKSSNSRLFKQYFVEHFMNDTISKESMRFIADSYVTGSVVEKNLNLAFEWYLKAAKKGCNSSKEILGHNFDENNEIKIRDVCKKLFLNSQKSIHGRALVRIGYQLYTDENRIEENLKLAFEFFLKAATIGNVIACHNVGVCYSLGIGTINDVNQAFEWLMKAAIEGFFDSQLAVGNAYMDGIGTEKDEKKAFEWYMKAALQGCVKAQLSVAEGYRRGIGTEKDEQKAFEWYMKAALQGQSLAIEAVALCYMKGIGIEKDETLASEWYQKLGGHKMYHGRTASDILSESINLSNIAMGSYNLAYKSVSFCCSMLKSLFIGLSNFDRG